MTSSKAVLHFSKSIIVDISETAALPDLIKHSYLTGGASIPVIIFVNPHITKIYGRHDHPSMKKQNYAEIFKETKNKIHKAQASGTFTTAPTLTIVKLEGGTIDSWKSSVGTEIRAKLIGIENDTTYLFETEAGKTIRATATQLDKSSITKARQAAGLK